MFPSEGSSYSYLGNHYRYICAATEAIIKGKQIPILFIRIDRIAAENLRNKTFEPFITKNIKEKKLDSIVTDQGAKFPENLSLQEKVTWLAKNDYIPSYFKETEAITFRKRSITNLCTNFIRRAEWSDIALFTPPQG